MNAILFRGDLELLLGRVIVQGGRRGMWTDEIGAVSCDSQNLSVPIYTIEAICLFSLDQTLDTDMSYVEGPSGNLTGMGWPSFNSQLALVQSYCFTLWD